MSMIVMEYDVERVYIPGAQAIQIYFRKQDAQITARLRKIAKTDGVSISEVVRGFLRKEWKVVDVDLAGEIQKRKAKTKISKYVREVIIKHIENGR